MALNPVCPVCGHKNVLVVPIFNRRKRYDPNAPLKEGEQPQPNSVTVAGKTYDLQPGDMIPTEKVVDCCGLCGTKLLPAKATDQGAAVVPVERQGQAETPVEVNDGPAAPTGGAVSDSREPVAGPAGEASAAA